MSSRELIRQAALPLSALVLANDDDAVVVNRVLASHGFNVARAADAGIAVELCRKERFDLAVYGYDIDGALELAGIRRPSSRPRVAVGLFPEKEVRKPAGTRLHFIVRKPFTGDLFAKTVKAAYGPIAADRRASFRHQVNIPVSSCTLLHRGELRSLHGGIVVNLSQTGMCLQTMEMLPQTASIELDFVVPGTQLTVRVTGTVLWAHASGRGGIKFTHVDSEEQRKLEDWLDSMLPGPDVLLR